MYGPPPGPPPLPTPPQRERRPLMIVYLIGGSVFAVLVLLFLIGLVAGDPDANKKPAAASSSASPAAPAAGTPAPATPSPTRAKATPTPSPRPSTPASVPSPTPQQQRTYLATIARIDPGLTVNEERAMRRAGRICERIMHPPGGNLTLEKYTVMELSGGNATINEAQARQVIKAVKVWCRQS